VALLAGEDIEKDLFVASGACCATLFKIIAPTTTLSWLLGYVITTS